MLNYDSALCCLSDHFLSHRAATIVFVTLGTPCSLMLQCDLLEHSMISKLSKEHAVPALSTSHKKIIFSILINPYVLIIGIVTVTNIISIIVNDNYVIIFYFFSRMETMMVLHCCYCYLKTHHHCSQHKDLLCPTSS